MIRAFLYLAMVEYNYIYICHLQFSMCWRCKIFFDINVVILTSKVWIVLCQSLTVLSGILPWPKYSVAGLVCKISMMLQPQISGFLVKKTTNEIVDSAAREKSRKTGNQNIFVQSMKRRLLEPKACSNSNAKTPIQKTIHVNQPKEDCTNELCVSTLNLGEY